MEDRDAPRAPPSGAPGDGAPPRTPRDVAQDWVTLWQSEVTAAAADREMQETWQALAALWADAAGALLRGLPDVFPASAGAAAPPRSSPADAASDAGHAEAGRDAELRRLAARVAELERRLASLERGGG